jgi:uncharacterized membrane protein
MKHERWRSKGTRFFFSLADPSNMRTFSLVAFFLVLLFSGCERQAPQHTLLTPEEDAVRISVREVNDGGVHFFTYQYDERNINCFVRTDGNGTLHTHYEACYSCFKYKRGFRVEGSEIRCIACNLKYKLSEEFWDYIGPCAPIPLRSKVVGNFIVIRLSVIQRGWKLF